MTLSTLLSLGVIGTITIMAGAAPEAPSQTQVYPDCKVPQAERYQGLFLDSKAKKNLLSDRLVEDVFGIISSQDQLDFPAVCGKPDPNSRRGDLQQLPVCQAESPFIRWGYLMTNFRWGSHMYSCCETKMVIERPLTVASLISGTTYNVVQDSNSYQLLHKAECTKQGAVCAYHGRCQLVNRVQWVLVINPATNGQVFVPTYVPNHCECIMH